MHFKSKKKLRCESIPWERFRYDPESQSIVVPYREVRREACKKRGWERLPLTLPRKARKRDELLRLLDMPSDGKTYRREEIKILRNNRLRQY
jgi:hypothetical protein